MDVVDRSKTKSKSKVKKPVAEVWTLSTDVVLAYMYILFIHVDNVINSIYTLFITPFHEYGIY